MSRSRNAGAGQSIQSSAVSNQAIGVFGGSFDPVHFGHLRAALEIALTFGLDTVRLVPNHQPPHRSAAYVSTAHRVAMLKRAIRQSDQLVLDDRELRRKGPSYTFDTLSSLRQEFGPSTPIIFALGADAFKKIDSWHRASELLEIAHIAVLSRPGTEMNEATARSLPFNPNWVETPQSLTTTPQGRLFKLEMTPLAISSTRIRAQISRGWSPDFLLPESVCRYIQEHGLYGLEKKQ